MRKNKIVILSICIILLILIVIFRNKEPLCDLVGVAKLNLTSEKVVKISDRPLKFMIESSESYTPFINFMADKKWSFIEQVGSGLIFEKNGKKITVESKMFTRKYIVILYDGNL